MTSPNAVSYPLRIPVALKAWLTDQAQQNFRSLNAEITKRLEESRRAEMPQEVR
jgi:hypothetical protein